MTQDDEITRLEHKIKALEAKKAMIEKAISDQPLANLGLCELDSFTDEEKCAAFDRIHAQCKEAVLAVLKDAYKDSETEYWVYEVTMAQTMGPDVWEVLNAALR